MQPPLTPVSVAAAAALLNSQGAAEYGSNSTVSPCVSDHICNKSGLDIDENNSVKL